MIRIPLQPSILAISFAAIFVGWAPSPASAEERTQSEKACLDALSRGQELKEGGKLVAAGEQFRACGRAECPKEVGEMCWTLHESVQAELPSVVLAARSSGRDLVQASVTIDRIETVRLDKGLPVHLDPGRHDFVFRLPHGNERTITAVLQYGIKNRELVADFSPAPSQRKRPGCSWGQQRGGPTTRRQPPALHFGMAEKMAHWDGCDGGAARGPSGLDGSPGGPA